jgi:hypothetical protein
MQRMRDICLIHRAGWQVLLVKVLLKPATGGGFARTG